MKRGQIALHETLMAVFMWALLIFAFIGLMLHVKAVSDKTLLEKNYYARDISLLTATIYAAPGNVEYTYEIPEKVEIEIEIKNSRVKIDDKKGS